MDHNPHEQDRALALKAGQGDEQAWRTIYEANCQPLFNFLCYQVGNREAARDLLQETFLTALKSLDRFRGDGSLLSWLRSIALYRSLDWKRAIFRRLRKLNEMAAEVPEPETPDCTASLTVESPTFRRALDSLSARQRACLLLRELEDLTFADIARELGCNEATARVHHLRARDRMKKLLAPENGAVPVSGMGGQQA